MAKAAKPQYQHAGPVPTMTPQSAMVAHSKSKRKRLAKKGRWGDEVENMTAERWKKVIAVISNGGTRASAAGAVGISPQTIDAYLIVNIAAYKQIRDAMLVSNRREWRAELIDAVLNDLSMGMTLKAAAIHRGVKADRMGALYKLVRHDKSIREAYDDARELQAESFLDETLDIADDVSADRLKNGRVNHEAVNRSKIRIDTRWRAMGAMVKKRFGDHKHVELEGNIQVNHIALLTGARKRLEASKPKTITTIDNESGEQV